MFQGSITASFFCLQVLRSSLMQNAKNIGPYLKYPSPDPALAGTIISSHFMLTRYVIYELQFLCILFISLLILCRKHPVQHLFQLIPWKNMSSWTMMLRPEQHPLILYVIFKFLVKKKVCMCWVTLLLPHMWMQLCSPKYLCRSNHPHGMEQRQQKNWKNQENPLLFYSELMVELCWHLTGGLFSPVFYLKVCS